jgi:hypothetical protein
MRSLLLLPSLAFLMLSRALGQSPDYLSTAEVAAAVAAPPNTGFVLIEDAGFATPSLCQAQMPSETVFTPEGWLNALSQAAKQQYLPFKPGPDDTLRVLRIISKGCANGTAAGPSCESITRVALLADKSGSFVAEAVKQYPMAQSWQNGYGATASCSALVSLFSMKDVARVRKSNGEFLIATFDGATPLKVYTVKEKHLRKLGM